MRKYLDKWCWRRDLERSRKLIHKAIDSSLTGEMAVACSATFRGYGLYKTLRLKQNLSEFLPLTKLVEARKPKNILEIGTLQGGSLFVWTRVAAPQATIVSVDLPGGGYGGGYDEKYTAFLQCFASPGQDLKLIRGDSHAAQVVQQVKACFPNGIDFLFIDGDHSYEGVKQDYQHFAPLVNTGGIIAFHDIVKRPSVPDIEVYRFWNELKTLPGAREFVEARADVTPIGIGVLFK